MYRTLSSLCLRVQGLASPVPESVSKTSPPEVVVMVLACSDLSKEWVGRHVLACSKKPLNDGHWA